MIEQLGRKSRNEAGATIVEFAIVGPICLLILFLTLDFLRLTYQSLTLQFVATRVMREVQVGPSARPDSYGTQEDWIKGEIIALSGGLGVSVLPENIAIFPAALVNQVNDGDPIVDDAGLPGELVAVRIDRPMGGFVWRSGNLLGSREYRTAAVVVGRNELW